MNQKGLIPIIYLIIGAVVITSAVFGVTKYKDEVTANVSKVLKPKIVIYNIVSTAETPQPPEEESVPTSSPDASELFQPNEQELKESTTIIEKLKKQIEALKQQPPNIIYKEVIKEIPAPTSAPAAEPELTPISTPVSRQSSSQSEITPNNSGQTPDLIIQSSAHYPSAPIKEDLMTFFTTIKNQGQGPANSSIVSLSIDEVVIGKASTITLLSNKAETITWGKIWKATYGIHSFEICADADSEIAESDETNNCYSSNFSVLKTAPLPDYIIQSATMTPSNPVSGDTLSFTTTVHNQGNADGTSSFTGLKIDEDNDGTWDKAAKNAFTDALTQGDSGKERWDFAWAPTKLGTHKYKICADVTFLIAESDENNNCLSKTFTVSQ